MPGVHIHKISDLDWIEQKEESKLTIPGSYWLCHKNKIYKFTFMYHHTMRDLKGFAYGKELLKVIRRIIKSQPCQGQQFDHSSWTRQDKMFATLKFMSHKEATTVSQAIILTIKIVKDETYESKILNRNKIEHLECESKTERRNSNVHKLKVNPTDTNKHISILNLNDDPNNLLLSSTNNEKTKDTLNIIKCNDIDLSNISTNECINVENKDVNKTDNCSITFKKEKKEENEFHNNVEKLPSLNRIESQELIQQKDSELQQLNTNVITQGSSIINSNDEGIIDSANLPYQYLIEKEIENAKKKIVKYPLSNANKSITEYQESKIDSTTKSEDKKIRKENNANDKNCIKNEILKMAQSNEEQCTKDLSMDSKKLLTSYEKTIKDNNKLKKIGESEKKMDDSIVKSSNITDLIMKGRMFMIQQDQDSVSVVEQETKSDTDEVLENSEKFETKEGEKCLLNSSLLKLTNLVTMIEMPKEISKSNYESKNTVHNINNNISLDSMLIKKDSASNQCVDTQMNEMHPSMFHLQDIPTSSKSCLVYEEYESNMNNLERKENDISSKIQSYDNESANISKETFNFTERCDVTNYSIVESTLDDSEDTISNRIANNSHSEAIENTSSNNTFSFPRIISDQIVTIDQIPLGLQKLVKERLSKRNTSINSKLNLHNTSLDDATLMLPNESTNLEVKSFKTDLVNVEKCLTPLTDNIETDSDDTSTVCSNIAVVKETEMPNRKRKRSDNHDNDNAKKQCFETMDDETLSSPKCKTYSSMNKKGKHMRKRKGCKYNTEMPTGLVKIQNSRVPGNKLQDITKEFYQDLMQHNEHRNNCKEKFLSRTKRSHLETNVENNNTRIKMLKFIEDITRGVKVVVTRMNIKSISSIIGNSSSLTYVK